MTQITTIENEVPDHLKEALASEHRRGSEQMTSDDLAVPRLVLIQPLSTVNQTDSSAYIPGSKPGKMYITTSKELLDEAIICFFAMEKEYVPKQMDQSGSILKDTESIYIGKFKSRQEALDAIAASPMRDTYVVCEVPQHYGLLLRGHEFEPIVVKMGSKSKKKTHREINELTKRGDRFCYVLKLTSVRDGAFFNYAVTLEGYPSKELFKAAETLYTIHINGGMSVDTSDIDNLLASGKNEEQITSPL